jgi:hypothetical protein
MRVTITTTNTIHENKNAGYNEPDIRIASRSKVNITGMEGYYALALFHSDDSECGRAIRRILENEAY